MVRDDGRAIAQLMRLGLFAVRFRTVEQGRCRRLLPVCCPRLHAPTPYEDHDENRSDQRGAYLHRKVRGLSKPRARARGRLRNVRRAPSEPPGRTPRVTAYTPVRRRPAARAARRSRASDPRRSRLRQARSAASVAAAAFPRALGQRRRRDGRWCGNRRGSECRTSAGGSSRLARRLSTIRIIRTSSGCPSPATATSARTAV